MSFIKEVEVEAADPGALALLALTTVRTGSQERLPAMVESLVRKLS